MPAAMVLAAGLGTRLRPLTNECAKPLVPVGDRPALAHVLDRLRAVGAAPLVINAHHRAEDLERFAAAHAPAARVSVEPDLLGTAGGLARAAAWLGDGDVLVWNADVLADIDLPALLAEARRGGAPGTLVIQRRPAGEGPVGLDREGRVVRLRAERFDEEHAGAEFLGVSVLGAALRVGLPPRGGLVEDAWLPLLRRGERLATFEHAGRWRDIGGVARYLDANLDWLRVASRAAWIGPGARVSAGVSLEETVLGAGADAVGSGVLARCVVWPGARAHAPLHDAVVTPWRVVARDEA
ncbi:MAG: NTP transferase domain-containing protein [Myxococcales bacterium]|nr:NTP transferase domain-containing protein [Myxococcales bacterium]